MGSIHPNLYGFLKNDYQIIGEYYLDINHCLCANTKNIQDIKEVYSQNPALEQCHNYINQHGFVAKSYSDTSLSAAFVAQS